MLLCSASGDCQVRTFHIFDHYMYLRCTYEFSSHLRVSRWQFRAKRTLICGAVSRSDRL